jgi:hypothetical protein
MHEFIHLLTDPAHWSFEVVTDVVLAVPAYYVGKWRVRVHDRNVHGKDAR